jgi:hypothetical protein
MATSNAKSNYLEQKIIEAVLKNTTFAGGANTYVALLTATATPESGTVTEVSGGSYARQAMLAASAWSAGSQVTDFYEVSNAADISFPVASADWGTIVAFALYDALTTGNMLYWGALDASKSILNGDQFKFVAGALKISES